MPPSAMATTPPAPAIEPAAHPRPTLDGVTREHLAQLIEDCPEGLARYHPGGPNNFKLTLGGRRTIARIEDFAIGRLLAEILNHREAFLNTLFATPSDAPRAPRREGGDPAIEQKDAA